jgi:hypothetical protein
MGGVRSTVKPQKLSLSKKTKAKVNNFNNKTFDKRSESQGQIPSAKNVREALSEGNITPLEAADLNPKGGLKPNASDVRAAYKSNNISAEEAYDLNPGASLKKGKGGADNKKESPINVSSERIYPTKEETQVKSQVGFNKTDLPTHGPGSEYNLNAGRQWNNG